MPLKSETVDAIFARLLARYGSAWVAKWNGVPMDAVKADWAEQLDGVRKEDVIYAIKYLPLEFPPTSTQFKASCDKAPKPAELPALSPPRDPARTAELAAAAKALTIGRDQSSPKEWAWRLKAREEAGEKLTPTQRAMYQVVTGGESRDGAMSESDLTRTAALKAASSAQAKAYAKTHGIDLEKTT